MKRSEKGTLGETGTTEMAIGQFSHFASAGCTFYEALFDEEGLIDLFEGAGILAQCRGNGAQTHRPPLKFINYREEDSIIYLIEAEFVDIESFESISGYLNVNPAATFDHSEVSYATQQ